MIRPGLRAPSLLLPLLLAACATGAPVTRQVVVPGGQFQAVQGEARFFVRSFLSTGSQQQEVIGARCELVTSLYRTEFVTPARVVVPNFGPQSPEVTVACRTPDSAGSASTRIVTRWQQPPGVWGDPFFGPRGGPWGPAWGPGWGPGPWGWSGPGFPVSNYPNINVTLYPTR